MGRHDMVPQLLIYSIQEVFQIRTIYMFTGIYIYLAYLARPRESAGRSDRIAFRTRQTRRISANVRSLAVTFGTDRLGPVPARRIIILSFLVLSFKRISFFRSRIE